MAIHALLYASRALVAGEAAEEAVEDIVQVARGRNGLLEVTGALIFSGGHFAQWLEGSREGVEELMRSITRDPRHTDIVILKDGPASRRRFPGWSLAYAGRSTFVDRTLAAAQTSDAALAARATRDILTLLEGLAAA